MIEANLWANQAADWADRLGQPPASTKGARASAFRAAVAHLEGEPGDTDGDVTTPGGDDTDPEPGSGPLEGPGAGRHSVGGSSGSAPRPPPG